MSLRCTCVLFTLLVASCGAHPAARDRASNAARETPTSVLWICIDALRADQLGCYGSTLPTSPRLDALAENGVRFRNAFSQAPWTKPSVPSMFTGLFPSEHQVWEGDTGAEGRVLADVLAGRVKTIAELLHEAGFATAAFVHNAHLKPFLGMAQGFEVYQEGERSAEVINAEFLDWRSARPGPYFAYLHWLDVHWPYRPSEEHRALFPSPPPNLDLSGSGAQRLRDRINDGDMVPTESDLAALRALYAACIHQTDSALGALLDSLEAKGELGRTLVVVTADHGEEFYEHGKIGHGHSLRDSLLHVPLVIAGPGVSPNRVVEEPVQTVDVLPTLLEWVGVVAPDRNSGSSFAAVLRGGADAEATPRPSFAEVLHGKTYQRSVRSHPWKLIEEYRMAPKEAAAVTGDAATAPVTPQGTVRQGTRAEVKGGFNDDDTFEAAALLVEDNPDTDAEIRGPVTKVDSKKPALWIGPMEVRLESIPFAKRRSDGADVPVSALRKGMVVDVDGEMKSPGKLEAESIELRDDKENSTTIKLEGRVEAVDAADRSIRLLGIEVLFEDGVALPGLEDRAVRPGARRFGESELQDPERWTRRVALYDLRADPSESVDVAAMHSEVVTRLAALFSKWSSGLKRPIESAEPIELDKETLEDLRRLGYVK